MTTSPNTVAGTPLTRSAVAALPVLIDARAYLREIAAPQATRIADRIAALLEQIVDLTGDVQAYCNKWHGDKDSELAHRAREATCEYDSIG